MHQRISNNSELSLSRKDGFTLIELSIVLVVIGLLAGGVTIGYDMYKNSKLMNIASETEQVRSHMKNFKDKYNYYPGDFPNATSLWTAMSGTEACDDAGNTSNNQASTTQVEATCDGRGNGKIGSLFVDSTQFANASNSDLRELRESFYAWQHLALAGYIDGTYSGYSTDNSSNHFMFPGVNVLASEYSDYTGYMIEHWDSNYTAIDATRAAPVQGSLGHLFTWAHPGIGINSEDLINSIQARKLDRKLDDGDPFTGNVFAHGREVGDPYGVSDCTTGTEYQVDDENPCGQYHRNFLE